jgi:hypothetical protein
MVIYEGGRWTMRQIGVAGIECFDGPCNPWSKSVCHNCPIRPMKVYTGNDATRATTAFRYEHGVGMMLSARFRHPRIAPYYAVDNGAYGAWAHDKEWDGEVFLKVLNRLIATGLMPDFVAVPDIVKGGMESLERSLQWIRSNRLPKVKTRYYLVVQPGMPMQRVEAVLDEFGGLFVGGGSPMWQHKTAELWIHLAHENRKPCHLGRVGAWDRIVWASTIGADSIDSTTWQRCERGLDHITDAKAQSQLEVVEKNGN